MVESITDKVCLFSKLPSYFGVDLRNGGITLTYSEKDKETDYIDANYNWLIGRKYELKRAMQLWKEKSKFDKTKLQII